MAIYSRDTATGALLTLASGQRLWIGTKAAKKNEETAGTMPNNCLVAITDDFADDGGCVYHENNVYVYRSSNMYLFSMTGARIARIQTAITALNIKPPYVTQGMFSRRDSANLNVYPATFTLTIEGIINAWYAANGAEAQVGATDIIYGQFSVFSA